MATDSILEKIAKNRVTALTGITAGAIYDNTIAAPQRHEPDGQTGATVPYTLLFQGPEDQTGESSWPLVEKRVTFDVLIVTRLAASETRSADEVLNSLQADVERAWMADPTCGGNAINSGFAATGEFVPVEGQPDIGRAVQFWVQYRHHEKNPKSLT